MILSWLRDEQEILLGDGVELGAEVGCAEGAALCWAEDGPGVSVGGVAAMKGLQIGVCTRANHLALARAMSGPKVPRKM